jgi:hypothetical protein
MGDMDNMNDMDDMDDDQDKSEDEGLVHGNNRVHRGLIRWEDRVSRTERIGKDMIMFEVKSRGRLKGWRGGGVEECGRVGWDL